MTARLRGFAWMAALAVMSAGLFYLLSRHLAHTLAFLPYLLFLACPVMHLFMHHGRGHRPDGRGEDGS